MYRSEAVLPEEVKLQSLRMVVEVPACSGQSAQVPRRNKSIEKYEGQASGAGYRQFVPLAKSTHGELWEIGIKMV
jgi:hypothetical protein